MQLVKLSGQQLGRYSIDPHTLEAALGPRKETTISNIVPTLKEGFNKKNIESLTAVKSMGGRGQRVGGGHSP